MVLLVVLVRIVTISRAAASILKSSKTLVSWNFSTPADDAAIKANALVSTEDSFAHMCGPHTHANACFNQSRTVTTHPTTFFFLSCRYCWWRLAPRALPLRPTTKVTRVHVPAARHVPQFEPDTRLRPPWAWVGHCPWKAFDSAGHGQTNSKPPRRWPTPVSMTACADKVTRTDTLPLKMCRAGTGETRHLETC